MFTYYYIISQPVKPIVSQGLNQILSVRVFWIIFTLKKFPYNFGETFDNATFHEVLLYILQLEVIVPTFLFHCFPNVSQFTLGTLPNYTFLGLTYRSSVVL